MNILIPDIWLRTFLRSKVTPEKLKEVLSLCGPSVERIYGEGKETVYDIEVTGNRPDAMSVVGIAREAAAILPRFGVRAELTGDPYNEPVTLPKSKNRLPLTLKTDPILNPRWMSVVFDDVSVKASPIWLTRYLELAGLRSINNVVDITNYLMRGLGQPAHVFDYDRIVGHKMILRASRKGEILKTLDGKDHRLPGNDIVIEDGSGKLIDLCGIMGGENSSVTQNSKRVILFVQTYSPSHIRKTSMALGHRTEAAALFEKGLDTELVKPVFAKGIQLMQELTNATIASPVTDLYPGRYKPKSVAATLQKIRSYIGNIPVSEVKNTLGSLGITATVAKGTVTVTPPSFRRDIERDVDVIEEIARIYGYHAIPSKLPEGSPPTVTPDATLRWEEEIKIRLRDWGYTELITYTMLSARQMEDWHLDLNHAYKIANPLSSEWVYMRPTLLPGIVSVMRQNMHITDDLAVFELGMVYIYREGDIPTERPVLTVAVTGNTFRRVKGLAEALFKLLGVPFPVLPGGDSTTLSLGEYGSITQYEGEKLHATGLSKPITVLTLSIDRLVADANPLPVYTPVPKFPPVVEDLSFIVPDRFYIGPFMEELKHGHPLVWDVTLLDVHGQSRTVHVTYQDPKNNLSNEDIIPVRNRLIEIATTKFGLTLKTA